MTGDFIIFFVKSLEDYAKNPNVYKGELEEESEILQWINENLAKEEIDEVAGAILDVLTERLDNLAVIFYDNDKEEDMEFIAEMENLDDECDDRYNMQQNHSQTSCSAKQVTEDTARTISPWGPSYNVKRRPESSNQAKTRNLLQKLPGAILFGFD